MDIRNYFSVNEKETQQNLWNAAKALLRKKCITLNLNY